MSTSLSPYQAPVMSTLILIYKGQLSYEPTHKRTIEARSPFLFGARQPPRVPGEGRSSLLCRGHIQEAGLLQPPKLFADFFPTEVPDADPSYPSSLAAGAQHWLGTCCEPGLCLPWTEAQLPLTCVFSSELP